jgi:putative membrane protein
MGDAPRCSVAALALAPFGACAHALDGSAATPSALALHWSFEPWVLGCLALSAGGYAIGLARLWRHAGRGRGIDAPQAGAFAGGWLLLALALVSPLDALGARLFCAHMVQHELLMVGAAPLLVLGRPLAVWAWALPRPAARGIGRFFHHPLWRLPWLALSAPLSAWLIHASALWLWHVPAWFDAALANAAVHGLQHASFLFSALLFWWAVLGARSRSAQGTALVLLFTTMLHSGALGALLALSSAPWYAGYAGATAIRGLAALEDQQLGGLLMWAPAGLAYLACALLLAQRWLNGPAAAPMPTAVLKSASGAETRSAVG